MLRSACVAVPALAVLLVSLAPTTARAYRTSLIGGIEIEKPRFAVVGLNAGYGTVSWRVNGPDGAHRPAGGAYGVGIDLGGCMGTLGIMSVVDVEVDSNPDPLEDPSMDNPDAGGAMINVGLGPAVWLPWGLWMAVKPGLAFVDNGLQLGPDMPGESLPFTFGLVTQLGLDLLSVPVGFTYAAITSFANAAAGNRQPVMPNPPRHAKPIALMRNERNTSRALYAVGLLGVIDLRLTWMWIPYFRHTSGADGTGWYFGVALGFKAQLFREP